MHMTDLKVPVDIGILTIRDDEFRAVLHRLPDRQTVQGKRYYNCSRVATKAGAELWVAVTCLPRQGQIAAHVVAADMIADLNPPWLFLVGIGGGIPNDEYSLGDVVVANRLNDFCVSAWLQNKPPEFSIVGHLMHKEVEALLANLIAFPELDGWNTQKSVRLKKPDVEIPDDLNASVYYGSEEWRSDVQSSLRRNFPKGKRRRPPKVRTAPVSSSDALIKNANLAEQWQKSARHTEVVEMELAGVYAAAHYAGDHRVVAIRGLSDIVGFKRSGEWTAFACQSAAAFALALIKSGIIKPRSGSGASQQAAPSAAGRSTSASSATFIERKSSATPSHALVTRVVDRITIDFEGAVREDKQHISNLITKFILAHEAETPSPELEIDLELLRSMDSALETPNSDLSNAMRLQLTRQIRELQYLKHCIERGIRLLALAGKSVFFDPDDIASCVPAVIQRCFTRAGYLNSERESFAVKIDLFTSLDSRLNISIPLTSDELNELLLKLGPGEPPLSVLQTPWACSELPPNVRLFKAFPAIVVEVAWKGACEDNETDAIKLCNYDRWRFGLA